jgi:CHAD domain-containing protein
LDEIRASTGVDLGALEERLQSLFTTEFERATVELGVAESRIEAAFDRGTISAGRRREPLRELEFELLEGDFLALLEHVRGLIPGLALELEVRSKAERGYQLAAGDRGRPVKARRPSLDAKGEVRNAVAIVVGSCVSQVAANTRGAASGRDPEYLHQLRVGLRRLRSALRVFRGFAPPEVTQRLVESLRGVLPPLGVARDWDVATELLEQRIAPGAGDAIDFAAVLRWARRRRMRARRDARAVSASSEFQQLLIDAMIWAERLDRAVAAPAVDTELQPQPALAAFARRTTKRLARKVEQSGDGCDWSDGSARHQLRIRLKRLRYACEFFGDCFKRKRVRRYLEHLEALQDLLGELNDLATARQLFADPAGVQGVQGAFIIGWLSAREGALIAALGAAWGAFRDQPRPA